MLLLVALALTAVSAQPPPERYKTLYFNQTLDHFGFDRLNTFQQKYLLNITMWRSSDSPIFFYTGNEGPIEGFASATGYMWDLAAKFGGMVVFAEHRYYGTSVPTGLQQPYEALSSEQALADYITLIAYLKEAHNAPNAPVIAVGGSYGGMLSAWLRAQHPAVVAGALAASAPIAQFTGQTPDTAFYDTVTADFSCAKEIGLSFTSLWEILQAPGGYYVANTVFKPCTPVTSLAQGELLIGELQSAFATMAELDYPYAVDYFGSDLPANPSTVACQRYQQSASLGEIVALQAAVSVAYNYSGTQQCWNYTDTSFQATFPGMTDGAWAYQRCTDMVLPFTVGPTAPMFLSCSAFPLNCWNITAFSNFCQQTYGVAPRPYFAGQFYGGRALGGSNIIFSNGALDPWHPGGMVAGGDGYVAFVMAGAAHHLDLRPPNPADPASVIAGRKTEAATIAQWLSGHRSSL